MVSPRCSPDPVTSVHGQVLSGRGYYSRQLRPAAGVGPPNSSVPGGAPLKRSHSPSDGNRKARKRKLKTETDPDGVPPTSKVRISCPFRKRNPRRFNIREYRKCALTAFSEVPELRRHICECHKCHRCERCLGLFDSESELKRHLLYEDNVLCEKRTASSGVADSPEDGITGEMESRLRSKKGRLPSSVDEQYRQIWSIVFPHDQEVPSCSVGFDPLVEDFELVEQFRDTASEMQHPLEQVGVPPNAIQPVLSIMAKHLNKIVSRHDIKPEESSGLDDIIDIPMKLHKPRANLIDTDLNRITTRALLPDDSWSLPDLGIIGADIPSDLFTELLVDNLGALNPREANTAGSVEPIEPSTALRRVSREVHSPSPTPSISLDDFINVENNFTLVGTSSESPPLSWAGSFGSSPGVDGPMPIDPMFGK
ncbi:hypothetical protein MGN70_011753 [Eutypa lata]|nr:hypothetical protein MGN70_011753 [Eutypa lata]